MKLVILLISLLMAPVVMAQPEPDVLATPHDSIPAAPTPHVRATRFIAPALMIGIGAWGVDNGWLRSVNRHTGRALQWRHSATIDDIAQFVPAATMLLPSGWLPDNGYDWRRRALLTLTAEIITEAIVQPTKRLVSAPRPDGSDNHSFPSGHTARAFMGAELLRQTHGTWTGIAGYAFATGVGVLRICNRRHALTDVIAGAGVGILSAQFARMLLPVEERLFGMNKCNCRRFAIIPAVSGRQLAACCVISF